MRVATGIYGLDRLLDGGFPKNHVILLSGTCGSGKTVFGLQFLYNTNDNGIFVTFEEEAEDVKKTADSFGWAGKSHPRILKYDPYKLEDLLEVLENNIREMHASRIVIDPISALGIHMNNLAEFRRTIVQIGMLLKKNQCTSLLLSEISNPQSLSRFGVEEFVCDGVIKLERVVSDEKYRNQLSIIKMRASDHSQGLHMYRISKKGVEVI